MKSIADSFSKQVREHRESSKLKLHEVAVLSGVSHSHINLIEKGLREPSLSKAIQISRALKIDLNKLIVEAEVV